MKVFWSWQSDHPGKVSRHFVREALEKAIFDLREEADIEEAARDVELDYDRKGIPGSPDLANVILEKIRNCAVFVADVTPVGSVTEKQDKRLINSNVAIELGYALSALSDRGLLMVLNSAYGTPNDLPFFRCTKSGLIYIRVFPNLTPAPLGRTEAMSVVRSGNLVVLNDRANGWSHEQNKYGVIVFESRRETQEILSATQLFKSQEIWGFDAYILSHRDKKGIPNGWHEYMIALGLREYVKFGLETLKWSPPLIAEIGMTNVADYVLHMDSSRFWDADWGPIHEQNITLRRVLMKCDAKELDECC